MSLVEIRRFADVNEAEIARGYLASQGVEAWVAGDQHARVDPLMQQALGWSRLSVAASDADQARALLEAVGRAPPPDPDAEASSAAPLGPWGLSATVLAGLVTMGPEGGMAVTALKRRGWARRAAVGVIVVVMVLVGLAWLAAWPLMGRY